MFAWKKTASRKLLRTVGYKRKWGEGVDGEIEKDRKEEKRYIIREVSVKIR